ncbi:MAG TPA: tetratricopeptide repeat protein, partial [Anaerolineae bacterium]|nr:tetratricopeptide repeat protein [Anaerolineae bacterium]
VWCWHVLPFFEQLDPGHGGAHTKNHLGILSPRQGEWDRARRHLDRACALWQTMDDDYGLMLGYLNLGMLLNEMERFEEALGWHGKALAQAKRVGEEALLGTIQMNQGNCLRLIGRLVEAEQRCRQAQAIFDRFKNLVGQGLVLDNLGQIYQAQGRWPEAEASLKSALPIWRSLNNRHHEIRTLTYLVEMGLARQDHSLARVWLAQAEQLLTEHDSAGQYRALWQTVAAFRQQVDKDAFGRQLNLT